MKRIIGEFSRKFLEEQGMWKRIERRVMRERTLKLTWDKRKGQLILTERRLDRNDKLIKNGE